MAKPESRWKLSPLVLVTSFFNSYTLAGAASAFLVLIFLLFDFLLEESRNPLVWWVAGAVWVLLIGFGVFAGYKRTETLKHAMRTKGDVIEIARRPNFLGGELGPQHRYAVTVQFLDEMQQTHSGQFSAALHGLDGLSVGSRIDIVYDCRLPERIIVVDWMEHGVRFDTDHVVRLKHSWIAISVLVGVSIAFLLLLALVLNAKQVIRF